MSATSNTEVAVTVADDANTSVEVLVDPSKDRDEDYNEVRSNLKELIDKGSDALNGILELARDTDHPRAYEVVGQIMKAQADLNQQLITLQKDMKTLNAETEKAKQDAKDAFFVGSTLELARALKELRDSGNAPAITVAVEED